MDIQLRPLMDSDYDSYVTLHQDVRLMPATLVDREIEERALRSLWDRIMQPSVYGLVITDTDGTFLGFSSIKDTTQVIPEISIEVLSSYRHQGVGYKSVTALMDKAEAKYGFGTFLYKVEPDNFPSLLLARKLGGTPAGTDKNPFVSVQNVEKFNDACRELITGDLEKIAAAFDCGAGTLPGKVLLFHVKPGCRATESDFKDGNAARDICANRKISKAARIFDEYVALEKLMREMEPHGEGNGD